VFRVDASWLTPAPAERVVPSGSLPADLAQREKAIIEDALRAAHGVIGGVTGAAAKLGLPRQTLESRMRKLGIDRYRFKAS
jgi:formate hydrogenlyase transcriptional activator